MLRPAVPLAGPLELSSLLTPETVEQIALICASHRRLLGETLIPSPPADERALALEIWETPLVVVSHGIEEDPLFNFGNRAALRLWEMSASEFVGLPSRYSAEASERSERERLLLDVTQRGYSQNYSGIRASRSGRRFRIERAVVINLVDEAGVRRGQAAAFSSWTYL